MAFTQITVTGTLKLADGTAAAGEVRFTPRVPMTNSSIVVAAPVTATLDGSGAFSVSLAATDDTGTLTADGDTATYLVEPVIAGQVTRSYQIVIGHAGGSLNLGSIIATTPTTTAADWLTQTQANALYAPYDSDLAAIGALSPTNDDVIQRKAGAWTNRTIAQLATDLTASAVQPKDADLTTIAGLTATTDNFLQAKSSAWASRTPSQVAADLVSPLSSSLQPIDSDLTAIAGLSPTNDDVIQRKAGAWTNRTMAQVKTDLALTSSDVGLGSVANAAQVQLGTIDAKGDILVGTADNTVARLAVGTNDQVLTADSAQAGGVKWAAVSGASGIPASTVDAKGDLIAGTANDTVARLAVGTDGLALVAASGQATGLQWAAPAPASHNHAASDINSGTVATARLGSGTASSSTFLRGDQTWATPVTANLLKVYNVKVDYSAAGNGTTDDTTAIQNAIDAAFSAGGGRVYFPVGTYKLTSALTLKRRVILMGEGIAAGQSSVATIIHQSSTTAHAITATDSQDMGIEDLTISGPGSGSGNGINFVRSSNPDISGITMRRVQVSSFGGKCIELSNPITSVFDRVLVDSSPVGFNVHGVTGAGGSPGTSCTFLSCYAAGCTQTGYRLDNMTYCAFVGCASDACGIAYELIEAGTQGISFIGCGCESMVNTDGTYSGYGWKINAAVAVTLTGCYSLDAPNTSVWVTGNANGVNVTSFSENTPQVGVTNSIKVDTGSVATVSDVSVESALSLSPTTVMVNDGGGLLVGGYGYIGGTLEVVGKLTADAAVVGPVIALADAATIATNAALGNYGRVTLGGNRTLGAPTNPTDGQKYTWELIQDGTGSRTLTLNAVFALGTTISSTTLTTTANKRDFLTAVYNSTANKWYVIEFVKGY